MLSLPFRPTVAQYRQYLTTHGVTVPSRLRKDDLENLALVVRYGTLTDVRRTLGNVSGVKLDEVALLTAWNESRPGMHPSDRSEVVEGVVPCSVVYPHMPHDDGTAVACTLDDGHDGDHMDRSHVEVTGEVMAWTVETAPSLPVVDDDARPVLASIALTPFQRSEVEHGLDVDWDDANGPVWGRVRRTGTTTAYLDVLDWDGAVYRVTSSRDILADNSTNDFGPDASTRSAAAGARSLTSLTVKLVDAAGGPDALATTTRRWVRPGDYTPVPVVEVTVPVMPVEPTYSPGTAVVILSHPDSIVRNGRGVVMGASDRDGVDGRVVKLTTGPQIWTPTSALMTDTTSPDYARPVWVPCEYCGRDVDAATVAADRLPVCDRSVCQQLAEPQATPVPCEYFALCENLAVGTTSHPVLDAVPTCQRCADRFDLTISPF